MSYEKVDPGDFVAGKPFKESDFVDSLKNHNWEIYQGKNVLVTGCHSVIIPIWAYMMVASYLNKYAKSIRYGNEHDNIVVYRSN